MWEKNKAYNNTWPPSGPDSRKYGYAMCLLMAPFKTKQDGTSPIASVLYLRGYCFESQLGHQL